MVFLFQTHKPPTTKPGEEGVVIIPLTSNEAKKLFDTQLYTRLLHEPFPNFISMPSEYRVHGKDGNIYSLYVDSKGRDVAEKICSEKLMDESIKSIFEKLGCEPLATSKLLENYKSLTAEYREGKISREEWSQQLSKAVSEAVPARSGFHDDVWWFIRTFAPVMSGADEVLANLLVGPKEKDQESFLKYELEEKTPDFDKIRKSTVKKKE